MEGPGGEQRGKLIVKEIEATFTDNYNSNLHSHIFLKETFLGLLYFNVILFDNKSQIIVVSLLRTLKTLQCFLPSCCKRPKAYKVLWDLVPSPL